MRFALPCLVLLGTTAIGCGLSDATQASGAGGAGGTATTTSSGGPSSSHGGHAGGSGGAGGDISTGTNAGTGGSAGAGGSGAGASGGGGAGAGPGSTTTATTTTTTTTSTGGPMCVPGVDCSACADCGSCLVCYEAPQGACYQAHCAGDATCEALVTCISNCGDGACIYGCYQANHDAATAAMQACACGNCSACNGQFICSAPPN